MAKEKVGVEDRAIQYERKVSDEVKRFRGRFLEKKSDDAMQELLKIAFQNTGED